MDISDYNPSCSARGRSGAGGQIGTVVEVLRRGAEEALLVEFSDSDGQSYAMAVLKADQLIPLHRRDAA